MYGENTIAAIRSVIGALWPPLWVPPKLARRRRAGCCKACQRSRKNRRRLLHAAHLLAGTRLHSCRVPARSVRGQRGASVGQEPRWEAIKERRRDSGFARELCPVLVLLYSLGGHFGNSMRYRLRNHGTSDGRTWPIARAAAGLVQWATSQGRSGAVGDVHKASNLFLGAQFSFCQSHGTVTVYQIPVSGSAPTVIYFN